MTVAIATAMAGKAVEVAGEPVRAAVAELSRRVRTRLRGRPSDEEALARAAEDPAPGRITTLASAIEHLMAEDPEFGAGRAPSGTRRRPTPPPRTTAWSTSSTARRGGSFSSGTCTAT